MNRPPLFSEEVVGVVAHQVVVWREAAARARANDIFGNQRAGRVGRAVFAVGAGGEEGDVVGIAELGQCGEGQLLIAAAFAPMLFVDQFDGRLAAGNQAVGARFIAHSQRHLSEVSSDFFGRSF